MAIPYKHLQIRTDDGVQLAVQSVGSGPPILMANGIGVRFTGLRPVVERLWPDHRVILWDYRGIGGSRLNHARVDLSIQRHARDGLAILDRLGIDRAVVLGWSMGVPVGLEMIRLASERVAGYGALFGAPGKPFKAGFPLPVALGIQALFRLSQTVPIPAQLLLDLGVALPRVTFALLSAIRFVGRDADREVFEQNVRGIAQVPKRPYFQTMVGLASHDARDVLGRVRCPVLVVAGTRDWLTPPSAAREMAQAIPDAELLLLRGATHFGLIEKVEVLMEAIARLLERSASE
ncbi:MAG: alpha/beta hydrolase [Bradymonadales bacterium]|nr:alpha/beta hydrolase [Bradymonadales bacterium]